MSEAQVITTLSATWRDYLEMCKPRVVLLMLLTTVVGMHLATTGFVPLNILVAATLGIALCAGSAATVNHLVDKRIDAVMARTRKRPLPTGKIDLTMALIFAIILGSLGSIILIYFVNVLTAILTLLTLFGYAVVYTIFLKRATPQNIVIGGLSGAMPPLLGWTAVTGQVDPNSLLLVLIIFAWTPPHFWALAIARRDEYARVDIPMLPVTHGVYYTKLHILLYTIIMMVITVFPFLTGMSSWFYLLGSLLLGLRFLYWSVKLLRSNSVRVAMQTFRYSIIYLGLLFAVLLIDHYIF